MKIAPEWKGLPVFIVAGGPSVATQNLELLRGHKVIAINSSFETVPWADILFFADVRWWAVKRQKVLDTFKGQVVSVYEHREQALGPNILQFRKRKPPGLAVDADQLAMRRTSLSGATNLAFHLGASSIIWLGADGRMEGNRSHHHTPHDGWKFRPERWPAHHEELKTIVEPLKARGVPVINASPGSAWGDLAPVMTLEQALAQIEQRRAA